MNMKQAPRWLWFILSTVLLCSLLGGLYGRQVEATTGADDSDVKNSLTELTRVYNLVEQNYADVVDPDKAIYGPSETNVGAIPALSEAWTLTLIFTIRPPFRSCAKTRRASTTASECKSDSALGSWASSSLS